MWFSFQADTQKKSHCVFGAHGRTLLLDVFVDGRKCRIANIDAPVTRSDTKRFFTDLHHRLVEPLAHVILGDLNCVVDTTRDIRGPGRGSSSYHAKRTDQYSCHLRLTDVWVLLSDDTFALIRTSRTTARPLNRICTSDMLLPSSPVANACRRRPRTPSAEHTLAVAWACLLLAAHHAWFPRQICRHLQASLTVACSGPAFSTLACSCQFRLPGLAAPSHIFGFICDCFIGSGSFSAAADLRCLYFTAPLILLLYRCSPPNRV
ncbi:hypothetical protein MRX96_042778 [Rhipicephalus microplus]